LKYSTLNPPYPPLNEKFSTKFEFDLMAKRRELQSFGHMKNVFSGRGLFID